jgi:hypothetical protein
MEPAEEHDVDGMPPTELATEGHGKVGDPKRNLDKTDLEGISTPKWRTTWAEQPAL